ncbi:hypothetical protein [Streptomyces sp. NPDC057877]|uniref:hypothetical protein n=1 Tax=Streptomyces sp. NPDC057877 TaxID=3346269 RepID=UPI00368539D6
MGVFDGVYLEDGFVLGIQANPGRLCLDVEVVLTPEHPRYRPPAPGEQYCYAVAVIEFADVRRLTWDGQGTPPAKDASGETDYGGIDALFWDGSAYHVEGDWGAIVVVSAAPALHWGAGHRKNP